MLPRNGDWEAYGKLVPETVRLAPGPHTHSNAQARRTVQSDVAPVLCGGEGEALPAVQGMMLGPSERVAARTTAPGMVLSQMGRLNFSPAARCQPCIWLTDHVPEWLVSAK